MNGKKVLLFYGTESFLIEERIKKYIERLPAKEDDINLSLYDLSETKIETLIEDAETFPFAYEEKIIIGKKAYFFSAQKLDNVEHDLTRLEQYLISPAPYTTIIFWLPFDKLDERRKVVKLLKEKGEVVKFSSLTNIELQKWVNDYGKRVGVTFSKKGVEELIILTNSNIDLMVNEIEKIAIYIENNEIADEKIVDKLVARTIETEVFNFIEQLAEKNYRLALQMLKDLELNKEEPIKILALIARQIQIIWQVKMFKKIGHTEAQIAKQLNLHPFAVKIAAKQSNNFSKAQLETIINWLAEFDYQMKTGQIDKNLALELLLFKIKNLA